jgi:hypothetical protein
MKVYFLLRKIIDYFYRLYIFLGGEMICLLQGSGAATGADREPMSHAYIIHIAGRVAGIVARDHSGQSFRFFASSRTFDPLEGALFDEPHLAEAAARRLYRARGVTGPLTYDDPAFQRFQSRPASATAH